MFITQRQESLVEEHSKAFCIAFRKNVKLSDQSDIKKPERDISGWLCDSALLTDFTTDKNFVLLPR